MSDTFNNGDEVGLGGRHMWTALEGVSVGGRYELRTHLATGGMAAVFKGWDYRLERPVAIKVLRLLDSAEPTDVERFRREARAAAALRGPNIVEVYDFFEDNGCYYLVMELVDGINLKQHIAQSGPLDPIEVFSIAVQVCQGMAEAHAAGFIHRDIKPQNILLGTDGSVKLADFGIVHIPWAPGFTTGGIVLGTADYISPEQAQGLTLQPTTDLYSLGVVLYEALTGALPFTGTTPIAVAMRHASEPVVPPRRLNSSIPQEVERVVLRAMRKAPTTRYQSATSMAAALQRTVDALAAQPARAAAPDERAAALVPMTRGSGEETEWRRLTDALLRPPTEDTGSDDEEVPAWAREVYSEAMDQPGNAGMSFSERFAAARRLATATGLAALLLVGILLLHLLV